MKSVERVDHQYQISGMSCTGCLRTVQTRLESVEGVSEVFVDLKDHSATIISQGDIPLHQLQSALADTHYHIGHQHDEALQKNHSLKLTGNQGSDIYYCPMHCEGDQTYSKPGDCPVCGMDLIPLQTIEPPPTIYACPMHPEIEKDSPGTCPICGMELQPVQADQTQEEKTYQRLLNKFYVAVGFTIPIFIIAMSEMLPDNPFYDILSQRYWIYIQFGLSIPVVFYGTWMFFKRAWRSLITWNLNMFTLIGIGAGVAWIFSTIGMFFPGYFPDQFKTAQGNVHVYFEAATVILTLVLLGQLLEARAHRKTNSAIKELLKLTPNEVTRIVGEKEEVVSIQKVKKEDLLRIKPGDKIPVDGHIVEGESSIDESMISGEPLPITKMKGDLVTSGTINGNQSFVMKAEKIGSETLLAQIIQMVNEASRSRSPMQKIADRISAYFVPIVVIIAMATFVVWAMFGPQPAYVYGMINAIAVLIIACPCALGLATPISVMVGVGKGAQSGILIKNAEALEKLDQIDVLIVDKTGTITEGRPTVHQIVATSHMKSSEMTRFVASVNQNSEHPLAEATLSYAETQAISLSDVQDFRAITGKGVVGLVESHDIALGNPNLMEDQNIQLPETTIQKAAEFQNKGMTVSYLALDQSVIGFVVIGDRIKSNSTSSIRALIDQNVEVIMMTGDNERTAAAVAEQVGITSFEANCLPEDKMNAIVQRQQQGLVVAMAGDGINDAPALAQCDVGIAMGTGTDVAIESAEITLVKGDLHDIVRAKKLSHSVVKNIKQNLFFALAYNSIGVPVAAGVLYPFFGILLSPMIAALAMSFSSVSVISNALRLRSLKL